MSHFSENMPDLAKREKEIIPIHLNTNLFLLKLVIKIKKYKNVIKNVNVRASRKSKNDF
jgi:hypothetical protein